MGKKNDKAAKAAKKQRGLEKSLKNQKKSENKNDKLNVKLGGDDDDNVDIDELLAELAQKKLEFQKVTIENSKRPSKRQFSTMVANPANRRELFLFGGELLEPVATFYNDLFVYSTHSDVWRIVKSPNSPLPRSGHAMCAHPSGVVLMHGGEFSSPKQTTFHHYGDTWVLDGNTKEWTKIEGRKDTPQPQPRSGHRMCVWKNYILLHGGYYDLGTSTRYLSDLWAFDVLDYKWHQIEFPGTIIVPEARSGHSLLSTNEGAILHGGYTKVKATGGGQKAGQDQQKGKVLQDSWILRMKGDLNGVTWERRKKGAFAPSPRIGCQLVPHRLGTGRGIMFGGVFDTDETDESLSSIFFDSIYSYQADANRWYALKLRQRRKLVQAQAKQASTESTGEDLERNLSEILKNLNINMEEMLDTTQEEAERDLVHDADAEDEVSTKEYPVISTPPHARFNSTICVIGDVLYIFGGQWEDDEGREYVFDGFYAVDLGKLDGVKVFWEELGLDAHHDSDMSDMSDEDSDMSDGSDFESENSDDLGPQEDDAEHEDEDESAKDPRPWLPHPKAFESITAFYRKHVDSFVEWALRSNPDARGKDLRKTAFELSESRWWERRESVQRSEDQLEDMGGVEDVVERTQARSGRR